MTYAGASLLCRRFCLTLSHTCTPQKCYFTRLRRSFGHQQTMIHFITLMMSRSSRFYTSRQPRSAASPAASSFAARALDDGIEAAIMPRIAARIIIRHDGRHFKTLTNWLPRLRLSYWRRSLTVKSNCHDISGDTKSTASQICTGSGSSKKPLGAGFHAADTSAASPNDHQPMESRRNKCRMKPRG